MKKLSHLDGSWSELQTQWAEQCHGYDEDFGTFAPETMQLLGDLVQSSENSRWDGVYGLQDANGKYQAVCFTNGAFIPNYDGRVLRVRHVLLSPRSDFGDFDEDWHGQTLGQVFERIVELSDEAVPCPHVKFHFRSPADLALFRRVKTELLKSDHFSDVKTIGAWLMLTKS
jgi:hypothetical protein